MSDWGRLILNPAWVDLGGGREETLPVTNFNLFIIGDFTVCAARHNLKQIPVRTDWRWRNVTQLQPGHKVLRYGVVDTVDLNVEFVLFRGVFVAVVFLFVAHKNLLFDGSVSRYHTTVVLDKLDVLVHI
jgi:hypothetical protein